tara:strand:- start:6383 stop:9142 length:2760 start_codon:yes stop_codon:yes gene_type:complete
MRGKQTQARYGAGILRSKLVKPQISGTLVPRKVFTTFADKLVNGMKVGLVIAPAGYGKSTLLSRSFDVLTDRTVHCAWLSLDDNDNDPLRLLSHLMAALNTLDSLDFQLETEQLGADSKAIIDHIVADTVTRLDALDFRHALFIDDYHTISNPEVHGLLERLVLYSPPKTMFVIASRKEPELAFKALRMREEVCQLSTQDLAFALDESEQFLNVDKQLGLNSQLVKALASRTEGWVAGLQLASLALAGRADSEEFVEAFSGTDRDVTDYLGEAVLNQQTDEIRRFLLWTSLLERMNADLVNAVLDTETAQSLLEQVEARNLFVIPLDRQRGWYRYHHLFGDFLKMQLAKEYPGIAEKVYQRAFAWCVEQGHHHEAIHYALCAGLNDQAIELIADIAKDLVQVSGEHWTLLHWLQQLPDGYVLRRPEIGAAVSWSLLFSRQFSRARDLLDMLDRHCEQTANHLSPELLGQLRCDVGLNRCFLEAVTDKTEHASEHLKAWLADNHAAEPRDLLTAYILQAYTSVSTFEIDLGTAAADKAVSIGEEFVVGFLAAWAQAAAGLLGMQRVDVDGAARHFRKGLEYNSRNASPYSWVGSLNSVLLAEALYEQNDLVQAETLLRDHFEYIENQSAVDIAYAGYRVMAKLQFIRTDLEAGLKVIRLGKESAIRAKLPRLGAMLSALEIHSLLLAGKSKEARYIAKESGFSESQALAFKQGSPPVNQELRALVQAELYLDRGSPKQAARILDTLVARAEETGRQRRLLEMLLLRARAHKASQRPDDAMIDLGRAIEIGAQGGLCRVFIDTGEDVHQLLRVFAKESSGRQVDASIAFLGKINELLLADLKKSQTNETKGEPSSVLIETLTKREKQILNTVITGETNKEVAEKLFISVQTVKWHLHQIYQKLGVKNRTSAIVKAQALSLL